MRSFQSVLLMVILLTAGGAGAALADGWGWSREGMSKDREQRVEQIYDQLGLSQGQRTLLRENKLKHKAAKATLARDMKASMEAVGEELKKKDLDMGKLTAMYAGYKSLHDQMLDERFHAILEARKILTQEQFAKFIELLQQRRRSNTQM